MLAIKTHCTVKLLFMNAKLPLDSQRYHVNMNRVKNILYCSEVVTNITNMINILFSEQEYNNNQIESCQI